MYTMQRFDSSRKPHLPPSRVVVSIQTWTEYESEGFHPKASWIDRWFAAFCTGTADESMDASTLNVILQTRAIHLGERRGEIRYRRVGDYSLQLLVWVEPGVDPNELLRTGAKADG